MSRYTSGFLTAWILVAAVSFPQRTAAQEQGPPSGPPGISANGPAVRQREALQQRRALAWLMENRIQLGLTEEHSFTPITGITDEAGRYHGRFRQIYKEAEVIGGNIIVHLDVQGRVLDTTQKLYPNIAPTNSPLISEAEAVDAALKTFAASERTLGTAQITMKHLAVLPLEELVDLGRPTPQQAADPFWRRYRTIARAHQYVWRIEIEDDRNSKEYRIDAALGRVVAVIDNVSEDQGNGRSFWQGNINIDTTRLGPNNFMMRDPTRGDGGGNVVRDSKRSESRTIASTDYYFDDDNTWGDYERAHIGTSTKSETGKTSAVEAMSAAKTMWDMLRNVFGRSGIDGDGGFMDIRVHYDNLYTDAHWLNSSLGWKRAVYLGDGASSTSMRTVVHELGHGLWYWLFGKNGTKQPLERGMNEGHGDIAGSLGEFYAWGINRGTGNEILDTEADWNFDPRMLNPEGYDPPGPETQGLRYWVEDIANREEHAVGCLYGHMFVFLAHGASPDNTRATWSKFLPNGFSGIGVHNAGLLWYRATSAYLVENGDFGDLREAYLKAAKEPGRPAHWERAVRVAFAAIGVGEYNYKADNIKPVLVSVDTAEISPTDESFLVRAEAADNDQLARVDFYVNDELIAQDFRRPFAHRVDVNGRGQGAIQVKAIAYDLNGNASDPVQRSVVWNGSANLLVNGGFESGSTGWNASNGYSIATDGRAYSGARHWVAPAFSELSQVIDLPKNATEIELSYMVRVEGKGLGITDQVLRVQLRKADGSETVLREFPAIDELLDTTTDPEKRNYIQRKHSIPERGQKVKLVLTRSIEGLSAARIRVDNVAVHAKQPQSMKVQATPNDLDHTALMEVTEIEGIPTKIIDRVEYLIDGKFVTWSQGAPKYARLVQTDTLKEGYHQVTARALREDKSVIAEAKATFKVDKPLSLLKNGDFEQKFAHWAFYESWLGQNDPDASGSFNGLYYARLGGAGIPREGYVRQTVTLPMTLETATLSFRIDVRSSDTKNVSATLRAMLMNTQGQKIILGTFNNQAATGDGMTSYSFHSAAIPPSCFGKTWYLQFVATETQAPPTSFRIDAVNLTYTTKGLATK